MIDQAASGDGIATRPSPRNSEPDAHGQAALLLAESVLHTLLEAGVLTLDQAIAAVRAAAEVTVDIVVDTGASATRMRHSLSLPAAIERSLTSDETGDQDTNPPMPGPAPIGRRRPVAGGASDSACSVGAT